MTEAVLAMIGVLLLVGAFFLGVIVQGSSQKRDSVRSWLKRNGCYTCCEKYRYSLQAEIDELVTDDDDEPDEDDSSITWH